MKESLIIQSKLKESFEKYSDNIALECGDRKVTYSELEREALLVSQYIIAKKIPRETFIGILCEDKIKTIICILGVLKAGCAFVPLEYSYPNDRLKMMIDCIDLKYLITDDSNIMDRLLVSDHLECAYYNEMVVEIQMNRLVAEKIPYNESDRIYAYFTSGSTGRPKAVVGVNKGLTHFVNWEINTFMFKEKTKYSQFTNCSFDAYMRDIFIPLCSGGDICIPQDMQSIYSARAITDWINENAINIIHCVPSLFRLINHESLETKDFKNLKFVLLAGEHMNPYELKNWYETFHDRIQLVNLYGPTETTLAKFYYLMKEEDVYKKNIPVGQPIKGARAIILKSTMEPCDVMEQGEIYIRTPYRSLGYYNDDELNKEKFIKNPFSENEEDIIYKTGDLGRKLVDGNIEILGRIDRQIKIMGVRIEPGEIEHVLLEIHGVKQAMVVARANSEGSKHLCAFVVTGIENSETDESIREKVSQRLPMAMVPSYIILLYKMPLTLNGKVDVKALPYPDLSSPKIIEKPTNIIENKVISIWSNITNTDINTIDMNCNLFQIGGNSLSILQLTTNIHKQMNFKVSLTDVFNHPTIKELSAYIKQMQENIYHEIELVESREYYELSSAQKRMYVLQQMNPESTSYNISIYEMLDGRIDKQKFEDTIKKLIQRHESLRTSIDNVDYRPVQIIHKDIDFSVNYMQIEENEINRTIDEFTKPFQLDEAPLFRIALLEINTNRHVLLLDIHHIIADGVSMNLFVRDLVDLYEGHDLPELKLQYKDYAEWQNKYVTSPIYKMQEEYWIKTYENLPPVLNLPVDFKGNVNINDSVEKIITFRLDEDVEQMLKQTVVTLGVSTYMVSLAVYNILMSKYCNEEDIVVGTAVAGRTHADILNVMGMFVNMIAIRNCPTGNKTFYDLLMEVKQNALQSFENQDYQFDDLIRNLNLRQQQGKYQLFNTIFQDQNVKIDKIHTSNLEAYPYRYKSRQSNSRYELVFMIFVEEEKTYFEIQYASKLFKEEIIRKMYRDYLSIMRSVLMNNYIKLDEIKINIDTDHKEQKNKETEEHNNISIDFDL